MPLRRVPLEGIHQLGHDIQLLLLTIDRVSVTDDFHEYDVFPQCLEKRIQPHLEIMQLTDHIEIRHVWKREVLRRDSDHFVGVALLESPEVRRFPRPRSTDNEPPGIVRGLDDRVIAVIPECLTQ